MNKILCTHKGLNNSCFFCYSKTLTSLPQDITPPLPLTPREQAVLDLRAQRRATRASIYGDFRAPQEPVEVKPFDAVEAVRTEPTGSIHPWMFR